VNHTSAYWLVQIIIGLGLLAFLLALLWALILNRSAR